MEKSSYFKKELEYIKDLRIRNSCKTMLELLPDYFFEIPASSTGKYHPAFTLGEGGLVRHVKVATKIAYDLLSNPSLGCEFDSNTKDIMLMAIILHDGLKSGLTHNRYTQFDHPILIKNYIIDNQEKLELKKEEIDLLSSVIETHMGPWTKDHYGNEVLRSPKTKEELFVHMCDYLASRKYLNVNFDFKGDILE